MAATAEHAREIRERNRAQVDMFSRAAADPGLVAGGVALGPFRAAAPFGPDTSSESEYAHLRGVVYAALRPIANSVAGLDVRVARLRRPGERKGRSSVRAVEPVEGMRTAHRARLADGRSVVLPTHLKSFASDMDVYETHAATDLIADPNPFMTDWHLKWLTIVNMDLTGRAYWWVAKARGTWRVWPLPTGHVSPVHDPAPYARWKIWPGGGVNAVERPGSEVVMFHYPDPSDLLGSFSPVQAQGRAIRADEKMQQCQEAIFDNGVFPRWAMILGDVANEEGGSALGLLDSEKRLVIETILAERYQTASRAGTPMLLDAIIKDVKRLSNTVEEMDFLDSGKTTYQRITQGLGASPYVMGDREPSSRAASAEARRIFGDYTLNPRTEMISKTLTKRFAPLFAAKGETLLIWIEPYTPDDREERRSDWELLARYQSCQRNELRDGLLALPPMVDGDTIPAPLTQVLVPAEVHSRAAAAAPPAAPRLARAPLDAGAKAWEKLHARHGRALERAMLDYFAGQAEELQRRLRAILRAAGGDTRGLVADAVVDEILPQDEWDERLVAAVRPACEAIAVDAATRALSRGKAALPLLSVADLPPHVREAIGRELSTILWQNFSPNINETTRGRLLATMREGFAAGDSEYQMVVRIGDSPTVPGVTDGVLGSQSNTVRASLIYRTETTGIAGAGSRAGHDELARQGLIQGSEWSATLDQYVRPEHLALHGVVAPGPRAPNGLFNLAGYEVPYPGHHSLPPEYRCGCRCTLIPRL